MRPTRFLLTLAFLSLAAPVRADPAALAGGSDLSRGSREAMLRLPDVVVTATREACAPFEAPAEVTVVTREEILASPHERLEDILRAAPGLHNFRHFGLNTNGIASPFRMRGVGSNRVLLLIDGVPVNDTFNNAMSWMAFGVIPKEAIERIEIVRGPASALYGSEGLGGVIQVFTRRAPREARRSLALSGGSAATRQGVASVSGRSGRLGFLAVAGRETSDGFMMLERPAAYDIPRYRRANRLFLRLDAEAGPNDAWDVSSLLYDDDLGQGRKHFHANTRLSFLSARARHESPAGRTEALLYLDRGDKTIFQDAAADNYATLHHIEHVPDADTAGFELSRGGALGRRLNYTFGAAAKRSDWLYEELYPAGDRRAGAAGEQTTLSPFVTCEYRLDDGKTTLHAGARHDRVETADGMNYDTKPDGGRAPWRTVYPSTVEGKLSPKVGVVHHPDPATTLRLSWSSGFRAPSLFERFKIHVRGGGTYFRAPNPDLEAETIRTADLGVERFFGDRLFGRLSLYRSEAGDYIGDRLMKSTKKGGKTFNEYLLDNISEVTIRGIETEWRYAASERLELSGSLTLNRGRVSRDEADPRTVGRSLANEPARMLRLGATFRGRRGGRLTVEAGRYADIWFDNENTLSAPPYWTVDTRLALPVAEETTLHVAIENLTDRNYPIFRSVATGDTSAPGRIASVGVEYRF